ncbi:MAG: FIST N-terminal domain-containing protein [Ghiorsea sp.]
MQIKTGSSTQTDGIAAIREAWMQLQLNLSDEPFLLICSACSLYQAEEIREELNKLIPQNCKVAGTSSCLGAMNNQGFQSKDGFGLSLMAFADDAGDFGVGITHQSNQPEDAAAKAVTQAITNANRPGEVPNLIWLASSPGKEEMVLSGITSIVGPNVPLIGGSVSDNDNSNDWWLFSKTQVECNGVLVIAMYLDCDFELGFQSGYAPTSKSGTVTQASHRTIEMIDHQPAAQVYNTWTNGLIEENLNGGSIFSKIVFAPLGIETGRINNVPHYMLMSPRHVLNDSKLELFSNIQKGNQVTLMQGSPESLTTRAASVVSGILERKNWSEQQIAGVFIVYCAGCMLGIHEHMVNVNKCIQEAVGDAAFQGSFTFGEQGSLADNINRHGNMMISAVVFANPSVSNQSS